MVWLDADSVSETNFGHSLYITLNWSQSDEVYKSSRNRKKKRERVNLVANNILWTCVKFKSTSYMFCALL